MKKFALQICIFVIGISFASAAKVEFLGGYRLDDQTHILVKIEGKSVWSRLGDSVSEMKLLRVDDDFSTLVLMANGEEMKVPIAQTAPQSIPLKSQEVSGLSVDQHELSPEQKVTIDILKAQLETLGMPEEMIGQILANQIQSFAATEAANERLRNLPSLDRDQIQQFATEEFSRGNLVFWSEDDLGNIVYPVVHQWPAQRVERDEESGDLRFILEQDPDRVNEVIRKAFEAYSEHIEGLGP